MSPEGAPSPDRDTLALIQGIERASRRSRPFFLFGLLAVILGFVTVSVYLYQDREEERAQKLVLERQVGELTRTLHDARALGPHLDESHAARERLRILLGEAIGTVQALPEDVAEADSEEEVRNQAEAPPATGPQPERPPPGAERAERPQPSQRPHDARRPDRRPRRPGSTM